MMFVFHMFAIELPKKIPITIDFLAKKLEEKNQSLQSLKANYLAESEKKRQATSGFMPTLDAEYTFQNQDKKNRFGMSENERENAQNIGATAKLNLFRGFGDVSNFNEAKNHAEVSRYNYYLESSKVFIGVLETLLDINNSITNIEIVNSSVENRSKIFEIAQNKFKNEAIAFGDLKTAESDKDTMLSEQYQNESNFLSLKERFVSQYNIPLEANYIIELPKNLPDTFEAAERLMIKNNFSIKKSFYEVAKYEHNLKKSMAPFMPKVDGFAQTSKRINSDQDAEYVVGVKASVNLFNGFNDSSKAQEASKFLTSARFSYKATLGVEKAKLKEAFSKYKNALEQKKLLENAVKGFDIAAKSAMIQYESGAKNISDILREQERLAEAKKRFANNEKDLRLNAWKLTLLIGRLHSSLQKL